MGSFSKLLFDRKAVKIGDHKDVVKNRNDIFRVRGNDRLQLTAEPDDSDEDEDLAQDDPSGKEDEELSGVVPSQERSCPQRNGDEAADNDKTQDIGWFGNISRKQVFEYGDKGDRADADFKDSNDGDAGFRLHRGGRECFE